MALTNVEIVRLLIGDTTTSPFYMLLTDEEIEYFLSVSGDDPQIAARKAAVSASMQLVGYPSRERTGDIEIWNNISTAYLKALENIIKTPTGLLPTLVIPYAGGISKQDMFDNDSNQDNVRPSIYQGFDKGERVYNHSNDTEDESSYFGIDGAAPYEGWNI